MGLLHWDLWVAAIGIAGVLLAIVLRFTFARKRPISNHPSCRKCGHNLFGLPETSTRCPECGTDLTAKRAILPHTQTIPTKRRWIVRAIMLIALVLTLRAGWSVIHNPAYTKHKPSLVLIYITERSISDPSAPLELYGRLQQDQLDWLSVWLIRRRAVSWVEELVTARQYPANRRSDFAPALYDAGKISQAELATMLDDLLTLDIRPRGPDRRAARPRVEIYASCFVSPVYPVSVHVRESRINGVRQPLRWKPSEESRFGLAWYLDETSPSLSPGQHRLEVIVDVHASMGLRQIAYGPIRTNHTLSTTITIPDPATTQPAPTP